MPGVFPFDCYQADQGREMAWLTGPAGEAACYNERCREYFGLSDDDVAGWHWQWAVHPSDLGSLRRAWSSALRTGEQCDAKFRLRRADGAYRWHLVSTFPLHDAGGQLTGWVTSCEDMQSHADQAEGLAAVPGSFASVS